MKPPGTNSLPGEKTRSRRKIGYICSTKTFLMKNVLLTMFLVLSQIVVFSQDEVSDKSPERDNGEIKTLFRKPAHPVTVGYYFGTEGTYTQFDGRNVFLGGLSMGVIVDHFFSVGLAGYGILNSGNLWYDNITPIDSMGAYLYGGYGGVKFEFRIQPMSPIHLNFPILIGGGGLVYNTWTYHNHQDYYYNDGLTLDWDAFFVVEPGVMVEVNLVRFMRLGAGISYRYAPDLDLMNTKSNLINNFNANFSLKFGKF
jgi:hypothetical protein